MQFIFKKLEEVKNLKEQLRFWCRQNGIKISFTVNMTFTKAKNISRKLQNTYKKGYGKHKARWLENQLKLFHFAVLALSVLARIKIAEFSKEQWTILEEAFVNKPQPILEYQAQNFTINKNKLKQKWAEEEDELLSKLINQKDEEPRWNQIAIQLYINSDKKFFRNGKQCRQRWLNHLDTSIKHDKWTDGEDYILMKGVLENGKKWSKIMRCFNNQRTQHMIKNRFLSLILKCKKNNPFIQDEESAIAKIYQQMGLRQEQINLSQDNLFGQRKLRPKNIRFQKQQSSEQLSPLQKKFNKIFNDNQLDDHSLELQSQNDCEDGQNSSKKTQNVIITSNPNKVILPEVIRPSLDTSQNYSNDSQNQQNKPTGYSTVSTSSPSSFFPSMTVPVQLPMQVPISVPVPFVSCNSVYPGYGFFQNYMSNFYDNINFNLNLSLTVGQDVNGNGNCHPFSLIGNFQ